MMFPLSEPRQALPAVAFVCPFTLIKLTGTPIRANLTIEVASRVLPCHVISLGGYSGGAHHEIEGVWVSRRGGGKHFRIGVFARSAARALAAVGTDIVHCFNSLGVLPAILYRRRKPEAKLILELHGLLAQDSESRWPGGSVLHRAVDRIAIRAADAIIAMSHSQRQVLLRRYRVAPESVTVIWGPVDLDLFAYLEPPGGEVFRVGYAGNDASWQGVESLMAAAGVFRDVPSVQFRLVGIRQDRFALPRGASVEFFPGASREETARLLSECHVVVSPRRGRAAETQYPFKLSCYLALGRPIIATDVSDQRMILDAANCGVVVPPDSTQAIVEAIRRLRAMGPAERTAMGLRARAFAEHHLSLEGFGQGLSALYDKVGLHSMSTPR